MFYVCFKYLGVNIDSTLSFSKHFDVVNGRMNAAISKMYTLRRYFTENTIKIFMSCYVVLTVDYCFEIWGCQTEAKIEKLQSKINRFLLSFFYPGLGKKQNRGSKQKRKQKINYYDLLDRVNLTTSAERRIIMLIKFVARFGKSELFENWFVFRNSTDIFYGSIVMSTCKSETFKKSILWSCTVLWNEYVRKCKNVEALRLCSFLTLVESLVIDKRKNSI